jgi:hypothetical protein
MEEEHCCILGLASGWVGEDAGTCWGLHLVDGYAAYLGRTASGSPTTGTEPLIIAKFVDGTHTANWHGYPADHMQNHQDRPPAKVTRKWLDNGVLAPAKIGKITRGQRCRL